ncbi:dihydropteroate synthase [Microbacterium sp. NPDC058342]|uniref:dihydropteroate synthase n=1 Tax=Microbacterium sp. NPDC058342 TaxID=3346454 RepID=UPI00364C50DC
MTAIWGILNVTPDSFSDGGRYAETDTALARAHLLRAQGAAVIDVGGESTRPGAERVSPAVEQGRVLPVIEELTAAGIPTSIDTLNADTAAAAVRAGARIVNDVSGGLADEGMLAAVADLDADIAIGHWRGPSSDMYARAQYARVAREVAGELRERVEAAAVAGIAPARIIVDPGVGFAKSGRQNWDVLGGLEEVVALGHRVLVGTSRKRFLADALTSAAADETVDERRRDLATAVTSVLAARAGAWAVRVHDVAATRDALAVARAWDGA